MSKNIDHPIALDLVQDLKATGAIVVLFKNDQRIGVLHRLVSIPKRPIGAKSYEGQPPSDFYSIAFTSPSFSYMASDIFIRGVIENSTIKRMSDGSFGFYIEERF